MKFDVLPAITAALRSCCVIGAYAMAARGYIRQTTDFDLLTADQRALDESTWSAIRESGFMADVRRGDVDDPLAGVVRIVSADTSIDVVVAKYRWQQDVIDRAEVMTIRALPLRVPKLSDLILLKLFAGGLADENDAYRLLEIGSRDQLIREVDETSASLPEEMQRRWAEFRARI